MDELLALMDDAIPAEETDISLSAPTENEEPREDEERNAVIASIKSSSSNAQANDLVLDSSKATASIESQDRVEIGVDNKLGIRMMKRQMSSIDLMDLISTNPYHSTASLAAMSLASLNRLLVAPTSVLSPATVCGKTNIVTVGIVFTNSGTRISANGRAFSVVSIGNLQTGPVASVFLFGEAYSKLCAKCPPGTVITLISPSLLSPKENSRDCSAVSFSVADPRQFLAVAQARDFGVCKATISVKRPDGQWISNGGRCKHFVDVHVSQYCEQHRNQKNIKNRKNGQVMTFMQQQRAEQRTSQNSGTTMTMQMPGGRTVVTHNEPAAPQSIMDELERFKTSTGRFQNVPLHMKKRQSNPVQPQQHHNQNSRLQGGTNSHQLQGRTSMHISSSGASSRSSVADQSKSALSGSVPVHGNWLNPQSSQSSATKKTALTGKKRSFNKDMGGYDGSVVIPKPSKVFCAKAPLPQRRVTPTQNTLTQSKVDAIRQQQHLVAERQKENTLLQGSISRRQARVTRSCRQQSSDDALKDSLFGMVSSVDKEQVLNATSRFAEEANAEAYAKSRRVVLELERREEEKESKSTKKQQPKKESAIQKEWVCATCKKTTKLFPKLCERARHKISQKRSIKKSDTLQERRMKLDDKSVEDGGLKLGAGLEWDRRRFS